MLCREFVVGKYGPEGYKPLLDAVQPLELRGRQFVSWGQSELPKTNGHVLLLARAISPVFCSNAVGKRQTSSIASVSSCPVVAVVVRSTWSLVPEPVRL